MFLISLSYLAVCSFVRSFVRSGRLACVCATDDSISHFPNPIRPTQLIESKWCCTIAKCSSLWLHYVENVCFDICGWQCNGICFLVSTELENAAEWKVVPNLKTDVWIFLCKPHAYCDLPLQGRFITTYLWSMIAALSLPHPVCRYEENGSFLRFTKLTMRIRYANNTKHTCTRTNFRCTLMLCDVLPQPISNRFIYHILLPFL